MISFWSVCLWLGVTLLGVRVTWVSQGRIWIRNHEFWGRWFHLKKDNKCGLFYLQISFNHLSKQETFVNYQKIFYLTLIMAAYGNMEPKLLDSLNNLGDLSVFGSSDLGDLGSSDLGSLDLGDLGSSDLGDLGSSDLGDLGSLGLRWWHLLGLLSIPIFGLLGQVKGMQFSVTPHFWRRLSIQAKVAMCALMLFLSSVLGWQVLLAFHCGELLGYVSFVLMVPLIYYLSFWYWINVNDHKVRSWHIHHWFIGYFCSFLMRYSDPYGISLFVMIIFWGVFLEGSIYYGATPII